MKNSLIALFTVLIAASADAQVCQKCYSPPAGWGSPPQCGITTYNGWETCEIIDGYICKLTGICQGSGPECTGTRPCPIDKWADGSQLPERARWMVASVEIRKQEPQRAKS
ncbi:MAG TPA: hypothetical protein VEK79_25115 [Thermoanaerobaculia bacterium]|nr:hypothetical protein [Thermoanaerobaculia bacterium]